MRKSYESESADLGRRDFESARQIEDTMGVAKRARRDLGASDTSASFPQDAAELLQLSQKKVATPMFGRTVLAFKRQRRCIHLGADLRRELVNALSHEGRFAQDWMSTQFAGEWPFPISSECRMRNCASPGCLKCKRRAVMIVRGITEPACRLRDVNNPDLAWLPRACHGADNSRAPHSVRRSAKTPARRAIRGPPRAKRRGISGWVRKR